MENPTQTFREKMNFVLQLIKELQKKKKKLKLWWVLELVREKQCFFCNIYFVWGNFFYYLCFFSIYSILNKLHNLLPHCSPSTTWHLEYVTLCSHSLVFSLFSLRTWKVAISEIKWIGPTLNLKLVLLFSFFTDSIAENMKLLKHFIELWPE